MWQHKHLFAERPHPTEMLAIEANKRMSSKRDHVLFKMAKWTCTTMCNCLKSCLKICWNQLETFALNSALSELTSKAPTHCWGPHGPAGTSPPRQPVAFILCNHAVLHHPWEWGDCRWITNVSWVNLRVIDWSGQLDPAGESRALMAITCQLWEWHDLELSPGGMLLSFVSSDLKQCSETTSLIVI